LPFVLSNEFVDTRAVANFFYHKHVEATKLNKKQRPLTRPFLERLVVFADQIHVKLTGIPLCNDTLIEGKYEPTFEGLNRHLKIYGSEVVTKPLTSNSVGLSYLLGDVDTNAEIEQKITTEQDDFLNSIWDIVIKNDYNSDDLFWANNSNDDPDKPNNVRQLIRRVRDVELSEAIMPDKPKQVKAS